MPAITPMVVDLFHGDIVTRFADVASAGIRGIIHKATEGTDYTDPEYLSRRQQALDAGLLWGAYHFMASGDPVAQARFFVTTAAPDGSTLLAIDHEDTSVPLADAVAFMQEVEQRVGRQCVIYSGSLIKEQIGSASEAQRSYLTARRLWLPEYGDEAHLPDGWTSYWLWQFTGDGVGFEPHTIAGLSGDIDINSFAGSADELAQEWAGDPVTAVA